MALLYTSAEQQNNILTQGVFYLHHSTSARKERRSDDQKQQKTQHPFPVFLAKKLLADIRKEEEDTAKKLRTGRSKGGKRRRPYNWHVSVYQKNTSKESSVRLSNNKHYFI